MICFIWNFTCETEWKSDLGPGPAGPGGAHHQKQPMTDTKMSPVVSRGPNQKTIIKGLYFCHPAIQIVLAQTD